MNRILPSFLSKILKTLKVELRHTVRKACYLLNKDFFKKSGSRSVTINAASHFQNNCFYLLCFETSIFAKRQQNF